MTVKKRCRTWQLQDAKSKFSNVVNEARAGYPQLITKHGKAAVYVISVEEYEKITAKNSLKEVLLNPPHRELKLDTGRQKDYGRDIDL